MSVLQRLASFISRFWGVTPKTLVITDLTYMWGDEVCIAGVDSEGNCVRPIVQGGVRRHQLFNSGRLEVHPRAKVQFDLSPIQTSAPHIEDQRFNPDSIANQGTCTESEWEAILQKSSFASVADIFDGYLEGGRRVPPTSKTRSMGTIGNVRILGVEVDDSYGRRQYRLSFQDSSGRAYDRFPVNDLAFRTAIQKDIDALGDERKAEGVASQALCSKERVYLRIGLARPEQLGNHPVACWTQVTGIYTFPDYLHGKTFADFE